MSIQAIVAAAALLASSADTATDPIKPVLNPEQAIAAADAMPRGHYGRFVMTVRATGKERRATYLNSSTDYRSADNVTFRLAPNVASVLTRRYGASADQYLKGKRVTVKGIVERKPIVNMEYGRVESFNRWAHEVYIRLPGQVLSVE
ncbi:hypothetical protein FHT00_000663 [Sphingomonas insulae]|uniref:Uncharacterized protein n=1 Tax=Sphingomonas insulae TaxID=424800 RepID=A0ABP3T1B9_9SPHN|nr:hypothetical protein [Sphingomonas insulae]NIJ28735.1 hypothetical protein [Sphingomonas insulae]